MLSKNYLVLSDGTNLRGYLFINNGHLKFFCKKEFFSPQRTLCASSKNFLPSPALQISGDICLLIMDTPLLGKYFCLRSDYSVPLSTKASNHMPKTSYRSCWWLIQVLDGDFGSGSYRNGTGYSMRNINDLRPMGERIEWVVSHERDIEIDEEILQSKDQFRQTMMRLRALIYNEFGLAIMSDSTSGKDKHGNGGHYYYFANPELLDKEGETLKNHIKFLAESETERDKWVSLREMTARFKGYTSSRGSMGFLSAGGPTSYGYLSKEGTSYRTVLGEENLELIQFAMQFGETLTIKYGKVRVGVDINAPYTLEPYQLKEIEGRWYVIGNLYPLGHKELAEIAVYDLARLEFADEENPDVLYEPVKGFDVNDKILVDFAAKVRMGRVIALKLSPKTSILSEYFINNPLCSAQIDGADGSFRIFIRFTNDLIVQLGAYGAELSFEAYDSFTRQVGHREELLFGKIDSPVLHALNLFRNTGE